MNMLMIICPEERQEEIRALIGKHDVHAYSEIENVVGEGQTGKRLGTQLYPEKSVLIFTVVPDNKLAELVAALKECAATLYPGEGMKAFTVPVQSLV